MKKNSLSENIVPIIALSFMLFAFTVFLFILLKEVKTTESTTITILATISNILMLIFGYYFGSTKNSRDKDKQIEALTGKSNEENKGISNS